MANVDSKLQSLLLDIESEDNARCNPTSEHSSCRSKHSDGLASGGGQWTVSDPAHLAAESCVELISHQSSSIATVESEHNVRYKLTSYSSSNSSESSIEDLTVSDQFLYEDCESNINNEPCVDRQSDLPTSMETDVIDLSSPSPVLKTCYVSKCQGNIEQVNVIDLSDSDMDISPEHDRKARELRQFLSSIREEIS